MVRGVFSGWTRIAGVSSVAAAAVGPAPGSELELGVERGQYHFSGGCSGTHNFADYTAAQVRFRHLTRSGWGYSADGAARHGRVFRTRIEDPETGSSNVGDTRHAAIGALRAAYHGRFGGAELGPAVGMLTLGDSRPGFVLLPSGHVWLGHYGTVHAWGSFLGGPTLSTNRIAGIGIGHQSPTLRLSLGRALSAGQDDTTILDLDYRLSPDTWIGGGAQLGDTPDTWGGMFRLGLTYP